MMVRFRMTKIQITQFAILKETLPKGNFDFVLQTNIKHSIPNKAIAIETLFRFNENSDDIFLTIGVQCDFVVHHDDWEKCTTENEVIIPKETIDYFISQTVGVTRGVLHCKTENTSFNSIVLPPLNVSKVVKDDIHISLQNTETEQTTANSQIK